jgi:DNA-directed RNA polymerase specialized sigma24 family protein
MSFPTTQWTMLAAATMDGSAESRQALEDLCADYQRPIVAALRARGHSLDDARDLSQDFFLQLFERQLWKRANRTKGRFRSFLMKVLLDLVAGKHTADSALKRGGSAQKLSLESLADAGEEVAMPDEDLTLEFDRHWATTLMHAALSDVEAAFGDAGKEREFAVLKCFLPGMGLQLSVAEAAQKLGSTDAAVKVAVHRLRAEVRDAMRRRVAKTVPTAQEVDDELGYLRQVLSKTL